MTEEDIAGTGRTAETRGGSVASGYVELHCKSFYSFGIGASHVHELLARAKEYGYPAMALTDTNLCGALEFARLANNLGIHPVTGGEMTLADNTRLTLLARTRKGYANLSRLFTLANSADRKSPRLDLNHLPTHSEGLILLTGGRQSQLAQLTLSGRFPQARDLLDRYRDWFGPDRVYVELQQNLLQGDTRRNQELSALASAEGLPVVATNDVHYHTPDRYRLQNALVAAKHNTTMDQALPHIRPNHHLCLKSAEQMERLFHDAPHAVSNTLKIADQCSFDLSTDLGYRLPEPDVPPGHTPSSHLRKLCHEAALRRYGSITPSVRKRLTEEFRLIEMHSLAGFLLLYREIVLIAHKIMEEEGLIHPGTPLERQPPGRGRGSSVALLVGYLIGISHVDPLRWNLSLERFISDDTTLLPDIDLDFPRHLRDKLIERIHRHFGVEYAVLTGAISTYTVKGAIQDLGKAFGLPSQDLSLLSKQIHSHDARDLRDEMLELPAFRDRVEAVGWKNLIEIAPQLMGAPKNLSQHVGGMILSSTPIPEMVPVRQGAIEGRFIMDWNKDNVADANFAKIDLLSLPALDQLHEALDLIEEREGRRPDLSRIDPQDHQVYEMITAGRSKGVFLLQSPAQLKMGRRLRPRNLLDLAYQVALIRPGVGVQGSAVSLFLERYRHGASWEYDHPLEKRALERGCGVIVWQEQVVQLIMDVAGMTAAQADEIRRSFARRNNRHLIAMHWKSFLQGAQQRGVPRPIARKIFSKINGHYMFPESHSHAFAITAYQVAWLKRYHPLEFFTTLLNNQPMGFYPLETLKQDAKSFGVPFLHPCINRSQVKCLPEEGAVRLGLGIVKDVGKSTAEAIVEERNRNGPYSGVGDLVRRTGLPRQAVVSLVKAGALDNLTPNRRSAIWEAGLSARPSRNGQRVIDTTRGNQEPDLADFTNYEKMVSAYEMMAIYPGDHLMEYLREGLGSNVLTTAEVEDCAEEEEVLVAGWPIARQHPRGIGGTVFVTIEDETADVQLIIWPEVFARYKNQLRSQVILAKGVISRWDGTTSVIVSSLEAITVPVSMPTAHDWH